MKKNSDYIKEFLSFLRQADTELSIVESTIHDKDNATQDILHHIELQECTPYDFICLVIALRQIRRERRKAKDTQTALIPIIGWANENQKVIRELDKLLGEVRKIEKGTKGRHYQARTNAVMTALKDGEEVK